MRFILLLGFIYVGSGCTLDLGQRPDCRLDRYECESGRCMVGKPWEVAGETAARVHDLEKVGKQVGGFSTRQEHALHSLQALDGHDMKLFTQAKEWCLKNLPPEDPSTLLHGDLSGQNIMVDLEGQTAPALIDWTFTILKPQ